MRSREEKYRVGVLGATGLVVQLFVEYLIDHPWFELVYITGSDRTIGQTYRESMEWSCESMLPETVGSHKVALSSPNVALQYNLDFVFSALHSDVAKEIEPLFAEAGIPVITNASSFRLTDGVPLIIPEVNGRHVGTFERRASGGFIVASPNCSTIGLVSSLAPLERTFGIEHIHVTTLQAISGAGIPGVASMHSIANVIPYIDGEEEKLETEPQKILGTYDGDRFRTNPVRISAQCNRVPVVDGHVCSVSVKLSHPASAQDIRRAFEDYVGDVHDLALPTKPSRLLRLHDASNHPQPRLHVTQDSGMSVAIGRLRACPINDIRFTSLVHNTKRGAAGNAVLIAELIADRGLFTRKTTLGSMAHAIER